MSLFFDTSVLVAAFWGDHPNHVASLEVFSAASKESAFCATHSLAELYSVTTRLPVRPGISPEMAMMFVEEVRKRLSVVGLDEGDYYATLQNVYQRGIVGGRIYDALLLQCARKVQATTIYTWNMGDFQRLAPDLAQLICTPNDRSK